MVNFIIYISFFSLLSTHFHLVYCQWYVGEEKQQTTTSIDTEDASKPIPATSQIQCVLRCQRDLRNGYFVKDKGQCFCLVDEGNDPIFSNGDVDGVLFEKDENQVRTFLKFSKTSIPLISYFLFRKNQPGFVQITLKICLNTSERKGTF